MQTTLPTRPLRSENFNVTLLRVVAAFAIVGALFAAAAATALAFFEISYRDRIYPGVRAWGVDLSGMTPEEASFALSGAFTYPNEPAFLLADGQNQRTITPGQLGASFDLAATVSAAYNTGRTGNWIADWRAQYAAWHSGAQIAPVLVVDEARTQAYLDALALETFLEPVEAALQADGVNVTATPGRIGRRLDVVALKQTLLGHLSRTERAAIQLPFIESAPLVLDAGPQAQTARAILSAPLTLTVANSLEGDPGPVTVDPAQLATMLRIERVQEGNSARFEMALNPEALRAVLEPLAEPLKREAHNARFIFNDETKLLELIQPSQDSRELDIEATIAAINAALPKGEHSVPLVFATQKPEVSSDATAEQLGIREPVSVQYTSFKGSGPERMQNIQTAAARFHGLLIPPGGTFSFSDNIGDISLDSGFAEALIIYGGRTIRGVGGGVCQVSTTLFRAVWFGGFPIVERNSHAYRVGYYEQNTGAWQGPGLDAAVFTPLVDLKFTNDTPYWLLMETYFYPSAQQLQWKFYSTSDGRTVETHGPVVENEIPAPEPLYEENPELASGEIKQVDFAAIGADVTVTRVVMRDGAQINTDERPLRTKYQPWRAIYQYGPGTPNIPTPAPTTEATPTP
ncbi:MAG: VanW family protein [Anaerolineales bacterium]